MFSRRECWGNIDHTVLSYHWADANKRYDDYQYLRLLYERLLSSLSNKLNEIHNVEHDLRYWRILVGPWLAPFTHMLFDRWTSINQAIDQFDINGTIILTNLSNDLIPNDMVEFNDLVIKDQWNHHIYSVILKEFTEVPIAEKKYHENTPCLKKANTSIKGKITLLYSKLASLFVRDKDLFFIDTYLPICYEMWLQLRFFQMPQRWRRLQAPIVPTAINQREWAFDFESHSKFEEFVSSMIPKQIPKLYLEGYEQLVQQIQKLPWPKKPKVIFTSSELWHGTVSMAYTAEKVEKGSSLVCAQHGGGYGTCKFIWAEEHEASIADKYLTWGWSDKFKPNIKPLGIIKRKYAVSSCHSNKTKIVLILGSHSRYSYRLYSSLPPSSLIVDYIDNSFTFVSALSKKLQDHLLVRLFNYEYGWDYHSRWSEKFPKIILDDGQTKMIRILKETKVFVYTYNSTGYLETFSANIPTVIFWDPNISPLRESVVPFFDELKRVGVFHETPESAALHIEEVWGDVDAWWSSNEVKEVIGKFKKSYCYSPRNFTERLTESLQDFLG